MALNLLLRINNVKAYEVEFTRSLRASVAVFFSIILSCSARHGLYSVIDCQKSRMIYFFSMCTK
jgi:hypothetical protein